jgi:hypothetical protein
MHRDTRSRFILARTTPRCFKKSVVPRRISAVILKIFKANHVSDIPVYTLCSSAIMYLISKNYFEYKLYITLANDWFYYAAQA